MPLFGATSSTKKAFAGERLIAVKDVPNNSGAPPEKPTVSVCPTQFCVEVPSIISGK